jgi:predicted  nucleic acid-binding Zn-ribbon protein
VNADPAAQLRLLDLQAADTALAQLVHRRSTLPELAALADATQRTEVLATEAAELATRLADVDAAQRRLEAEVDNVRARTARDERRLTGGGLPAKELESLQHEIATLARRQSSLEDDVLDMMEERESLDSKLQSVATRRADLDAEREDLGHSAGSLTRWRGTRRRTLASAVNSQPIWFSFTTASGSRVAG